MTHHSPNHWPDGTPRSQRNAFNWREYGSASMELEDRHANLSRIARDSKDERIKPSQAHTYSKARPSK